MPVEDICANVPVILFLPLAGPIVRLVAAVVDCFRHKNQILF